MSESTTAQLSGAATDPGQRGHNEDSFLRAEHLGLYLVADGVGGRDAGEVASRLACDTILARCKQGDALPEAFTAAHTVIREAARSAERSRSMAATAVAVVIDGDDFRVAWSGDSRAYLWDGAQLLGLTRDHSLVEAMVARGEIPREQAANHPRKNVILAALGGESVAPEVGENHGTLAEGCKLLLCSDGLTDPLTSAELCETLALDESLQVIAEQLVARAKAAGGRDNITVLLATSTAGHGQARADLVYERFDAGSGSHEWPAADLTPAGPRIMRAKGRRPVPADAAGAGEAPHLDDAPQHGGGRRASAVPWFLGLTILAAITLCGAFYFITR